MTENPVNQQALRLPLEDAQRWLSARARDYRACANEHGSTPYQNETVARKVAELHHRAEECESIAQDLKPVSEALDQSRWHRSRSGYAIPKRLAGRGLDQFYDLAAVLRVCEDFIAGWRKDLNHGPDCEPSKCALCGMWEAIGQAQCLLDDAEKICEPVSDCSCPASGPNAGHTAACLARQARD